MMSLFTLLSGLRSSRRARKLTRARSRRPMPKRFDEFERRLLLAATVTPITSTAVDPADGLRLSAGDEKPSAVIGEWATDNASDNWTVTGSSPVTSWPAEQSPRPPRPPARRWSSAAPTSAPTPKRWNTAGTTTSRSACSCPPVTAAAMSRSPTAFPPPSPPRSKAFQRRASSRFPRRSWRRTAAFMSIASTWASWSGGKTT